MSVMKEYNGKEDPRQSPAIFYSLIIRGRKRGEKKDTGNKWPEINPKKVRVSVTKQRLRKETECRSNVVVTPVS